MNLEMVLLLIKFLTKNLVCNKGEYSTCVKQVDTMPVIELYTIVSIATPVFHTKVFKNITSTLELKFLSEHLVLLLLHLIRTDRTHGFH